MTIISGERILEDAELSSEIVRAAGAMAAAGIGPGDAVALLLRNDFAFFIASLAARRLGAYATPINWHGTNDEISYILADSGAKLLIAHADLLSPLKGLPEPLRVVSVPTPPEIASAYAVPQAGCTRDDAELWEDWLAKSAGVQTQEVTAASTAMIYTSGTTGRPKGVQRAPLTPTRQMQQQRVASLGYGLVPGEPTVVLMNGPMYHSAPNSYGLLAAAIGATIVLEPRFDAVEMLQLIDKYGITNMHMVPTMFVSLLKLPAEVRQHYNLSTLRFVVHGAAPCPIDVKRQMIEWWGPVIHEYYGSTETGLIAVNSSEEALRKPGTVGRALPGVTISILDDDGKALPAGAIGDVYVSSETAPEFTYHGRSAERSAISSGSMITVGDIGWLDEEGSLFLCDRRRDMIISGGVNIYPAEIEAALITINGIRDCAVFGIPDAEFGESVCAHVELTAGTTFDPEGIRFSLGQLISRYKVPRVIELADHLPREDSGKIFKRLLRESYWAAAGRTI